MKVVVFGATGNAGTALVRALGQENAVDSILGVSRRAPSFHLDKVTWVEQDIVRGDLTEVVRGADAVFHLAWLIQPSHNQQVIRKTNLVGTERILDAVSKEKVRALIYASSVGAYSPGPKRSPVDESWPTGGIHSSPYSRQKAQVERMLDAFEAENPAIRVVRLRPGLIFRKGVASEARRFFLGPFFPPMISDPARLPFMPHIPGVSAQVIHSFDVAEAYRLALLSDVRGAFNVAAEPAVDGRILAEALGKRGLTVPFGAARAAMKTAWKMHLIPGHPEWLDMGIEAPLMATTRIERDLGFTPRFDAISTVAELLEGMAEGTGEPTPVLQADSASSRAQELKQGVGQFSPDEVRP